MDSLQKNEGALESTLFTGIDGTGRNRILAGAQQRSVPSSHVLIQGGERARRLFLLVTGRAKYYRVTSDGKEVLLWSLTAGDVFGIGTMLRRPIRYIGTAETLGNCELYIWEHEKVRKIAATYPQVGENLLRIVLQYVSDHADRLVGLVTETAHQRVARSLLGLANRVGTVHQDGVKVEVTNEHLSALANVSPFTTSRALNRWERAGALTKTRGKVHIHVPEKLVLD